MKGYRYERKFCPEKGTSLSEIEAAIKNHPSFFREQYQSRQVNSIYLDTPNLRSYDQNKIGLGYREKIRVRWYGDTYARIENLYLEFKIKKGSVGRKEIMPLSFLELDQLSNKTVVNEILLSNQSISLVIREKLKSLEPTLFFSYTRKYFIDASNIFRLTLDYNQVMHPVLRSDKLKIQSKIDGPILELKYYVENEGKAEYITNLFPWRVVKNSKYVKGIDSFVS